MSDSNVLHITGGFEIDAPLENDTAYQFEGEVTTYSTGEKRSNQDGTFTFHHKAKISSHVALKQGLKVINGKSSKSEAQLTRGAILGLQNTVERMNEPRDEFYTKVQQMIRRNLETIYEQFKNEII